jgi:hypothetical protein
MKWMVSHTLATFGGVAASAPLMPTVGRLHKVLLQIN